MYGTPTDPMPYIYGAYFCGLLFCIGGFTWVTLQKKALLGKLETIKSPDTK